MLGRSVILRGLMRVPVCLKENSMVRAGADMQEAVKEKIGAD